MDRKDCAVLVYIFCGDFAFGSPREYDPSLMVRVCRYSLTPHHFPTIPSQTDHFVANDIVFVIPNYRLNVFGFWRTDTDDTTGNYFTYGKPQKQGYTRDACGSPAAVSPNVSSSGLALWLALAKGKKF